MSWMLLLATLSHGWKPVMRPRFTRSMNLISIQAMITVTWKWMRSLKVELIKRRRKM